MEVSFSQFLEQNFFATLEPAVVFNTCSFIQPQSVFNYFSATGMHVTSFSSIAYYSNSGIDLKNVIRTKTPVLYF